MTYFCKITIRFVRDNYLRELGPVVYVSAKFEPAFARSGTSLWQCCVANISVMGGNKRNIDLRKNVKKRPVLT